MFFAYPYGSTNTEIKAVVQTGFQGACGTRMDFVKMHSDIYELPRIDMFYFSNNSFFRYVDTLVFSFYCNVRRALRSVSHHRQSRSLGIDQVH
jgi:hypothetical protein